MKKALVETVRLAILCILVSLASSLLWKTPWVGFALVVSVLLVTIFIQLILLRR